MRLFLAFFILCAASAAHAGVALQLQGQAVEGGLLVGKTDPGAIVTLDGQPIDVSLGGDFLLGFGRDSAGPKELVVRQGTHTETRLIEIVDRTFKIERIDGLPRRTVTPDPADLARIKAESEAINAARQQTARVPYFIDGFQWPAIGRISGVYGSQRILNGEPRRPHFGTDVAAPIGTPVRAMADGRVTFTHTAGMFFNGKTVLIDHGMGLRSIYIHLNDVTIEPGATVSAGEVIGTIGQTGRATGPHLHFGLTWKNVPIDAEVVLGPMPR